MPTPGARLRILAAPILLVALAACGPGAAETRSTSWPTPAADSGSAPTRPAVCDPPASECGGAGSTTPVPDGAVVDGGARPEWPAGPPPGRGPLLRPAPKLALAWSAGGGADPLRLPIAVAADRHGDLYVLDAGDQRLRVFDRDGRPARAWGGEGEGDGRFRFRRRGGCQPAGAPGCALEVGGGVAVDASDRVYVADYANHRIQVFDRSGRRLAAWGRGGDGDGEFALPAAVAADGQGRVYVSEAGNRRVQVFDGAGTFLGQWGGVGSGAGGPEAPGALAVDGAGRVHVADARRPLVRRVDADGRVMAEWAVAPAPGGAAAGVAGLAVDARGLAYASVADGVALVGPDGRALATVDRDWRGDGRLVAPAGVAVDGAGDLFVADREAGRLHKFRVLLPAIG